MTANAAPGAAPGTTLAATVEAPAIVTPLRLHRATVIPEWVDYNGHLSEAYYVLIFGHATDALLDAIGMDAAYRTRTGRSVYTVDARIRYLREVHQGEAVEIRTWIAGADRKRLLILHRMYRLPPSPAAGKSAAKPVAETELVLLSVGPAAPWTPEAPTPEPATPGPQAMPFEAPVLNRVRRIATAHADAAPTLPDRWKPPAQKEMPMPA